MAEEKTMATEKIYTGKIINVRRDSVLLPDGRSGSREVVVLSDAVAVVALTENEELLMVKQYRYPTGKDLWEIPAGKLEPGEHPLQCAQRELEEETGYRANDWQELFNFYTSPGFCTERIYLFMAKNLVLSQQKLDQDEFIEVQTISLKKCLDMTRRQEITDAKTIIGLLAVAQFTKQAGCW